jgi:hypothetical protein
MLDTSANWPARSLTILDWAIALPSILVPILP